MEYKIYSKKEVLNCGINAKGRASTVITLFFKINSFEFGVVYQPRYISGLEGLSHFSFYALTRGFEKYTQSGYRSNFVQNSKSVASYEEIKDYFIKQLKDLVALENKSLKPVQLSLF